MVYYFDEDNKRHGPIHNAQLIELAKTKVIGPETWVEAKGRYYRARKIRQLESIFNSSESADSVNIAEDQLPPLLTDPIVDSVPEPAVLSSPPMLYTSSGEDFYSEFERESNDACSILKLLYKIFSAVILVIVTLNFLAVSVYSVFLIYHLWYATLAGNFFDVLSSTLTTLFVVLVNVLGVQTYLVAERYIEGVLQIRENGKKKKVNILNFLKTAPCPILLAVLAWVIGLTAEYDLPLFLNIIFSVFVSVLIGMAFYLWISVLCISYSEKRFFWSNMKELKQKFSLPAAIAAAAAAEVVTLIFLCAPEDMIILFAPRYVAVAVGAALLVTVVWVFIYTICVIYPFRLFYCVIRSFLWAHAAAVRGEQRMERAEKKEQEIDADTTLWRESENL